MKTKNKRFAKIKGNASQIFWKKACEDFNVDLSNIFVPLNKQIPQTYIEFRKLLRNLANKTFEIDREYSDRIVLNYPPELRKPYGKGEIVGIDLEKSLVKII